MFGDTGAFNLLTSEALRYVKTGAGGIFGSYGLER